MKKILSLLLALTMTFGVFSSLGVSAEETENVTEEVTHTYGADNLNEEEGELKIAFIGGSITQGAGEVTNKTAERYSGKLVNDYFKVKFPNKTITEINAGIGGTPSEYGIFRLGKDVSAFAPDVVFVEFAVNDLNHAASTAGQLKVRAQMESIVRQLEALPKIPVIIFLYSHCENRQDYLENSIKEHEKIAKYYGIGSINLHEYVVAEEAAGNIDWYNEENVNSMSGDGTHPNTAGYAMYADYIADCLEENYTRYFKKLKVRNAQFEQSYIYANPHTVAYDDEAIEYTGTWTESPDLDYLADGTHDWVIYPENLNSTFIQAQSGGETVSYTFTGRSIGIAYGKVYNGGKATYVVDEGTDKEITGEIEADTDAIRYYQTYKLIANDLEYGEHTIKLTNVAVDDVKTNFAFSHFLVDDQEPVIGVDDVTEYAFDYVPGEMPKNLIDNGTNRDIAAGSGEYYFGRNNSNVVRSDFTTVSPKVHHIKYAFNGSEEVTTLPAAWTNMFKFDGFEINSSGTQAGSFFTTKAGTSYVIGAKLKNVSTNGVTPYFGASMTMYTVDLGKHQFTKEYGATGMPIGEDWTEFKGTIKLPDTWQTTAHSSKVFFGMPAGTPKGAAFLMDLSVPNGFYFAEEVAYDIKNEIISGESSVYSGESATFEASVLNQLGAEGYLVQDFDWYVMDTEREEFIDGFTVEVDDTTTKAIVTPDETVPTGKYDVVAVSNEYKMAMGQTIKVIASDYYEDYVPGEMPKNLIDNGTNRNIAAGSGEYYFGRNNGNVVRSDFTTVSPGVHNIKYAFNGSDTVTTLPAAWANMFKFDGFEINNPTNGQAGSYFTTSAGKSYVIGAKLKNVSTNGVTPYFGASMTMYTVDLGTHQLTKEYGEKGMPIGEDWTDFKGTIKLPDTWQTTPHSSKVFFGMPAGTPAGAAFLLDLSVPNGFYFAEEVPYEIKNTKIEGPDKLQTGHSATYKAEVLNQIGSTGYLEQNFTWYVMDTERTEFVDGFTVTEDDTSSTVTVIPGDTVSTGRYSLVAISDDYDMAMGADIRVIADDYYDDHEVPAIPENIFETLYGETAAKQARSFQRNTANVQVYDSVEPTDDCLPTMKYNAAGDIGYGQYNALDGWILNKTKTTTFAKGETYLLKVRAKDASTEGNTATINAVIHNETGAKLTHSWPLETEKASSGLKLTDEYADYIFTIPVGDAFDESSDKHYLTFGFAAGTFAGTAFEVDTTNNDSFYLAKEIVYNIKNTVKTGSAKLKAGETVTLQAQVVNQLDKEGTLAQSFTWVALDTARKNVIEGITVTPSDDTKTATVSVSDSVELGTYTIVAVSEDYDIAKGINIEVVTNSEKISSLELLEDSGYVMFNASVEDTTAENIFFVLAAYTSEGMVAVKSQIIPVENGTAGVTNMMFDDVLESGTVVKAFVWDYDKLSPIQNTDNFVDELTVQ